MQPQHIESADIIWKFHVNPSDHKIFLECKNEHHEFYLWDYTTDRKWFFPAMDKHTTNLIQLQYPYIILNYLNTENLIHSSTLACYDLSQDQIHWASSEYKLERCFYGVLQVYNAKISPKKTEFIDYNKQIIAPELLNELNLDLQFAEITDGTFQLEHKNVMYALFFDKASHCLKLTAHEFDKLVWEYEVETEDYREEYDYLMRISDKILFMLDKHRILILQ